MRSIIFSIYFVTNLIKFAQISSFKQKHSCVYIYKPYQNLSNNPTHIEAIHLKSQERNTHLCPHAVGQSLSN